MVRLGRLVRFRYGAPGIAVALMGVLAVPSAWGLEAKPATITWDSVQESTAIQLSHNGQAVAPDGIGPAKLYAGGHDYDHMIQVRREGGKFTVAPTAMLELGTYDLVITAAGESVTIPVKALLPIVDVSLAARAERQGVTVEDVKAQLGISQRLGVDEIRLQLPGAYYLGQALTLTIPRADGRAAELRVDGELVEETEAGFRHVFMNTGIHDVSYIEREGGRTVALGLDTVVVAAEPRIPVAVEAGTKLTLQAPAGYGAYTWRMDQAVAGSGETWQGTWEEAGSHEVLVQARSPKPGSAQPFRELRYAVTVE